MNTLQLKQVPFEKDPTHNSGQHTERVMYYNVHGFDGYKLDNTPHDVAPDLLDMQIKTARATVCRGTDLKTYINMDAASKFVYVTKNLKYAVIMDRAEWLQFIIRFSYNDVASDKKTPITRLKHESMTMLEYLGLGCEYSNNNKF